MAQKAQTSLLNGAHNASDLLEKESRKRKEELKKKETSKPKEDPKKKMLKPIQVKSINITIKRREIKGCEPKEGFSAEGRADKEIS